MIDHDTGFEAREAARKKYKPERIRWLLIAEAPPDSLDRFFYFERVFEKDYLYMETMRVLFPNASESDLRHRKVQYLQWFKANGFYLIDVMDEPIVGHNSHRSPYESARMVSAD